LKFDTALLASWCAAHPLLLYSLLGLLLIVLATYLRVRTSDAYDQTPDQIVERVPGDRLLGPPKPALPEAEKDLDFALLSQAAYDDTPHGQKQAPKESVRSSPETDLNGRGWHHWTKLEENKVLAEKLQESHLRVQVWIHRSQSSVAVTFGGTVVDNDKDWISNLRWFIPFHKDEYTETVQVFNPAFAEAFVNEIQAIVGDANPISLYSTGHSLGGGLAQQFAYALPLQAGVPRVKKVYAFDPSPVTGYFSVSLQTRRANKRGLLIDRIYERGEILAYLRSIMNFIHAPSAVNAAIRQVRYNLFYTVNPISGHSIAELASKLWDLVNPPAAEAAVARPAWRRPKMW
jgi:hypothetical protein